VDRIDFDGNYEPLNCRWITQSEQLHNTRRNVYIEINGMTKTMTQWAEIYGVNPVTVSSRYRKGISGLELFKEPEHDPSPIYQEIDGRILTLSEWAREYGLKEKTVEKNSLDYQKRSELK
jgi:hypothetical protein